jgi:hypothetical protein
MQAYLRDSTRAVLPKSGPLSKFFKLFLQFFHHFLIEKTKAVDAKNLSFSLLATNVIQR